MEPIVSVAAEADHPRPGNAEQGVVDYTIRAQWIRAAILGAEHGIVSMASLLLFLTVRASYDDDVERKLLMVGLVELVTGTCCMAIGEFVSELTHRRHDGATKQKLKNIPSSMQAALASAPAFALGAVMPLLAGIFVSPPHARVGALLAVTSAALAGFGATGGYMGGTSLWRSALRLVAAGWLAMAATLGFTWVIEKLFHAELTHIG